MPVDADDPPERADLVFGEAGVKGVITGAGVFQPADPTAALSAADDLFVGDAPHPSSRVIPTVPPPTVDDDAWIIFTSGSTGVPKGVAVSHRSAAAFVDAEARLFLRSAPLGPGDRVLAGLSVAFDASCEEMWLAWRHGACLVPAPRALVRSGEDLGPWLVGHGITVVSTVPTLAALWPQDAIENVRLLIFGGEACPPELVTRLVAEGRELWNTYGPTEATVVACAALLDGEGPVRIGLPLDGWALAVVDATGNRVADGDGGRAHHRRRRPRPLPRSGEGCREVRPDADPRLGPRVPLRRPGAARSGRPALPGPRRRSGQGRRSPDRARRGRGRTAVALRGVGRGRGRSALRGRDSAPRRLRRARRRLRPADRARRARAHPARSADPAAGGGGRPARSARRARSTRRRSRGR